MTPMIASVAVSLMFLATASYGLSVSRVLERQHEGAVDDNDGIKVSTIKGKYSANNI